MSLCERCGVRRARDGRGMDIAPLCDACYSQVNKEINAMFSEQLLIGDDGNTAPTNKPFAGLADMLKDKEG